VSAEVQDLVNNKP